MREVKHFIGGKYVGSVSDRRFVNRDPATGAKIGETHEGGHEEIEAAVSAARAALRGPWSRLSLDERTAVLHRIADGINARFDEFLDAECGDTGKPKQVASQIDIPRSAANFSFFAEALKGFAAESFMLDTKDSAGALSYTVRKPKGVIGVISPWNMPLLLMTWKVAPALACGNSVVVKPSEETPTTAALLGDVMNAAGVPPGVYNVVHGFGPDSAGAFLTEHPDVDAITFTGETSTGETIMRAAASGVRDISFELGGKNPGIVFADCDMNKAVAGTLRSVFDNCGQICLSTERLYVERAIFDEFVVRLKTGAEHLVLGAWNHPGTTLGPLISQNHRDKVLVYYKRAIEQGATVITGGGVPEMPGELAGGAWVQPTIWTGLSDDSVIVREEIFGPCCHVRPFDSEDEVIALANDTRYGLGAALWSENTSRAHRVAQQLGVGTCWVNSWMLRDLRTPFGGSKHSGIGREGGVHSLKFYTELQNICVKL
ncbi:MAG: 2-hydroxymuconic semialdehyde dehydrogenase [Caldilineaceae bacterium]|nr:2-hydroxymuconic semialdehyde dehydrogenase [Caldilineaceae bacterium]